MHNCQHWKWPRREGWHTGSLRLFLDFWIIPAHFLKENLSNKQKLKLLGFVAWWQLFIFFFFKSAPPIVTFQFLNQLGYFCDLFRSAQNRGWNWRCVSGIKCKQTLTSCSLKACSFTPASTCVWSCKYDQLCAFKNNEPYETDPNHLLQSPYGFIRMCKTVSY